jgi:hypothetical protein
MTYNNPRLGEPHGHDTCTVEGCDRPRRYANGMCAARWRRLVWRPQKTPAVRLEAAQSRDAKRRRRAAGERI